MVDDPHPGGEAYPLPILPQWVGYGGLGFG